MLRISWRLQRLIAPGPGSSQYAFLEALQKPLAAGPAWLDIGCGRALVPTWLPPRDFARYQGAASFPRFVVGLDSDKASLDGNGLARRVRGDIRRLPFASGSFELVTANMVVEHLSDPRACLREIRRVLKPSGLFVFHTPNLRSPLVRLSSLAPEWLKRILARVLEARSEEDVFPAVYRLNTSSSIRQLAESCGFRVREINMVMTVPATQAFGPLVVFELFVMRLLHRDRLAGLRPDIVAVLEKPPRARTARLFAGTASNAAPATVLHSG